MSVVWRYVLMLSIASRPFRSQTPAWARAASGTESPRWSASACRSTWAACRSASSHADRMRRWLDEPHPQLDGSTPRQAAAGERRTDVIRLVSGIENGAERARRRGQPFADVAWMYDELGLDDMLAA